MYGKKCFYHEDKLDDSSEFFVRISQLYFIN